MRDVVGKKEQGQEVPSLRIFEERTSLEEIRKVIGEVIGEGHRLCKKVGVYMSREYGGDALKEIGDFYGVEGAAVSQAARRFREEGLREREMKKLRKQIVDRLQMLRPGP